VLFSMTSVCGTVPERQPRPQLRGSTGRGAQKCDPARAAAILTRAASASRRLRRLLPAAAASAACGGAWREPSSAVRCLLAHGFDDRVGVRQRRQLRLLARVRRGKADLRIGSGTESAMIESTPARRSYVTSPALQNPGAGRRVPDCRAYARVRDDALELPRSNFAATISRVR
jgi:hypothetical protein